jgi:hypothetical protein
VRPSPPLLHHARRCGDIPALLQRAETRHCHNSQCATYGLPVNGALELAHHGGQSTNYYAATLEAAPVRAQDTPRRLNRSGIHQDGRQFRRTVRHIIYTKSNSNGNINTNSTLERFISHKQHA